MGRLRGPRLPIGPGDDPELFPEYPTVGAEPIPPDEFPTVEALIKALGRVSDELTREGCSPRTPGHLRDLFSRGVLAIEAARRYLKGTT